MVRIIISEFIICVLTGSIPVIILSSTDKSKTVAQHLASLSVSDPVVFYLAILFVLNYIVYLLDREWFKPSDSLVSGLKNLHYFTHQVGFSLQNIYRVLAGAIPASVVVLLKMEGFKGALPVIALSTTFCIFCFILCCWFTSFAIKSSPRA